MAPGGLIAPARGPLSSDCHSWGLRRRFPVPPRLHAAASRQAPPVPNEPLMMPFVLTDGKTEAGKQLPSSPTDLSFLCVRRLIHQSLGATPHRSKALPALSAPTSAALPPFAPALTFIYLDLFHVGANNPLTGSFIWMTSSNPRPPLARLIPLILPSD